MEKLDVNGTERSYLLHLPPNPVGRPLIIALHPLGSNPNLMEAMTGFSGISERETIVAYPEGTKVSEDGMRSWNARFCCKDALAANADDVGFLSSLIDTMVDRFRVSDVLVTGFSNGGMLAHLVGIELSDKIAAIAPVAATLGRSVVEMRPKGPLPILIIHGTEDRLVPLDGRESRRLIPVAQTVEYWARHNGCSEGPITEDRDGVEVSRYAPCSLGAEVIYCKVKDAGHVWPGGRVHMHGERDPHTLDASAMICNFFRALRR
ncbi:MAG: PHB depolymerase family esterase [Methanomassiliicoccus sp.]|nr:PHB depolymerase family esterase [Methanomassiliicoccus sp.]